MTGKAVDIATPKGLEMMREAGKLLIESTKEKQKIRKQLESLEWGNALSVRKANAIAALCHETGANPAMDLVLCHGKPYLTADYWMRKINNDPLYVDYEQYRIQPGDDDWENLGPGPDLSPDAHVIVTKIRRFPQMAYRAFESGRCSWKELQESVVTVKEANWAPKNSSDSVGKTHPALTARTRSFRRCAARAFSSVLPFVLKEMESEQIVEAAWEEDEGQNGEVVEGMIEVGEGEPKALPEPEPEPEPDPAAREIARRGFWATFKELGPEESERYGWAESHGFPKSSKDWTTEHFGEGTRILVEPIVEEVKALCEKANITLEDASLQVLGFAAPEYASHWKAVKAALVARTAEGVQL